MSYNEFVLLFNLNVYNFSVYILRLDQRPQVDSNASKKLTTPVRFIPWPFPSLPTPGLDHVRGCWCRSEWNIFMWTTATFVPWFISSKTDFTFDWRLFLVLALVSTPAYGAYWAHFTSLEGGSVKKFNCQVLKEVTIKDGLWMRLTSSLQLFSQRFDKRLLSLTMQLHAVLVLMMTLSAGRSNYDSCYITLN